jgi:bifunctional non-homologous end joining protein LigD
VQGGKVVIFSKGGSDFTNRFPRVAAAAAELPVKDCIIDGEIVACMKEGLPDFRALHGGNYAQTDLCVWCFNLLKLNGDDIRHMPLIVRRLQLGKLLKKFDHDALRYSEAFTNAEQLLEQCEARGLEGILCKERDGVYHSGTKSRWLKIKTAQWREANKDRGEMFVKKRKQAIA